MDCTIKKDKIVLVVPPFSSSVPSPPIPFFLEQPLNIFEVWPIIYSEVIIYSLCYVHTVVVDVLLEHLDVDDAAQLWQRLEVVDVDDEWPEHVVQAATQAFQHLTVIKVEICYHTGSHTGTPASHCHQGRNLLSYRQPHRRSSISLSSR